MEGLDYKIIGSGSSGNCIVIENVMIDCGLPFISIKESLYDIDVLLITHKHSDHIKDSTYNRIRKEFPNIITIANYEVAYKYDVDMICNEGVPVEAAGYIFLPFRGEHGDVLSYGYCWEYDDQKIIYATDMNNFDNAPDIKFDYLFLESNHDEHKINAIESYYKGKKKYGYDVYASAHRHCSTQKCLGYYYAHRKNKDSKLIELHKSSRFY